ncbi:MAG: hypothetical protein WC450_04285 [Candidatus Omnitrophota bacterium]
MSEDKVQALLQEIIHEANLKRKLTEVVYREDYQDYRIILDDVCRCEIREKLVQDYIEFHHKDTFNEMCYLMEHAIVDEQLQYEQGLSKGDGPDGVVTDDNKYDFL